MTHLYDFWCAVIAAPSGWTHYRMHWQMSRRASLRHCLKDVREIYHTLRSRRPRYGYRGWSYRAALKHCQEHSLPLISPSIRFDSSTGLYSTRPSSLCPPPSTHDQPNL